MKVHIFLQGLFLFSKLESKFIVLDGPDGCGKSTQTNLLAEWVRDKGVEVSTFRDPGTTAIGEQIRQILLNPEHVAMGTTTELLLYMAARAQLWHEEIGPALKNKHCVILDRWLSSTCAYQGYAGGYPIEKIIQIASDSLEKAWPDLTVVLDIDLESAGPRLNRTLDRMELKGKEYHEKVRQGFLKLAESRDGFVVVNAAEKIEEVHKNVVQALESNLG